MQSPVQFLGKENVHQLGFAVGVLGAVALGQRQVVKVERARSPVEQARGRDDRGFRRNERLQQEIGQEEGRQVVHLNGQFVPVDGEQTATHQTAGIVRQYVNARQVRLKSFGQFPYLIEVGEVGEVEGCVQFARYVLGLLRGTAHDDHPIALDLQLSGGRRSDTVTRSGDDHYTIGQIFPRGTIARVRPSSPSGVGGWWRRRCW